MSAPPTLTPKDMVGISKVPLISVVPPSSIVYEALAMRYGAYLAPRADGGLGYGPFNWRTKGVRASIYVDTFLRHAFGWWDGEDLAADSKVHHLAHLKASCGVVLDAIETGTFIDDRPPRGTSPSLFALHRMLIENVTPAGSVGK